jgi:hypothetical protein
MDRKPGKLKENLKRSFTQRFESNDDLRERLSRTAAGGEHPEQGGPRSDDDSAGRMPTVEETHETLLAGLRKKVDRPKIPLPESADLSDMENKE